MDNQKLKTSVTTGLVRLSYAHIWQPKAVKPGQDEKYSVSVVIPKSDKATIEKIKKAVANAKTLGAEKFGSKFLTNLKSPLHDGDLERPDDATYKNCYFLNANSASKPGIVDINCNDILDQNEVYSGCYGRVSVNFYAFNKDVNKGIAVGLGNIQKLRDGEPLGGRTSPETDFNDDFQYDYEDDYEDDLLG